MSALRVLVAGAGFAGVEAVLALAAYAGDRVRMQLVAGDDHLRHRPLSVLEPSTPGEMVSVPLAAICASADAGLVRARVLHVDAPAHRVHTDATTPLAYDVLVVALGARRTPVVPGAITFDGTRGIVELRRVVGFIPVDAHGRVDATAAVYAAGDAVAYPIKQGGLATEQADAVARAIAARAGAPVEPQPFVPRLRGFMLTGEAPLPLEPGPAGGRLDWTHKVVGEHLSRWLERHAAATARTPASSG